MNAETTRRNDMDTTTKRPRTAYTPRQRAVRRFATITEYLSYQLENPARRRAFLKRIGYERNPQTGEIVVHSV